MIDRASSLAIFAGVLAVVVAYATRVARAGPARHARVDRAGGSFLLGKGPMQMGYWALRPLASACVAAGFSANAVSCTSLALAAAAALALAVGHLGVGAALSVLSAMCDAIDGLVARETNTASDAGEVLDATVDRYAELLFFGGVAFFERSNAPALVLSLAATAGALMVSYATAKAEAMHVEAPRGSMRRQERAVYLTLGAALSPLAAAAVERWGLPPGLARAPLLAALALVAVVGNLSALRRLHSVARSLRSCPHRSVVAGGRDALATDHHAPAGDALR